MKNLLLLLLAITVIFSSCEKEEEPHNIIPFSCKIDGSNLSNATINTTNTSGNLSITATTNSYSVTITIQAINSRTNGDVISFSSPNFGNVSIGNTTYSNTYFDPAKGEIAISNLDLSGGKISGAFFFEAQDVTPNEFATVNVTEGSFSNISF
jgi:hypothetical protein